MGAVSSTQNPEPHDPKPWKLSPLNPGCRFTGLTKSFEGVAGDRKEFRDLSNQACFLRVPYNR